MRRCHSTRSLIVGLAVAALLTAGATVGISAAGAVPPPSPWLQSGYNAAGSHANLAEKTLNPGNVAASRLQRTIVGQDKTGCDGGADAVAFSDARIYVTANNTLTAYTFATGAVIWTKPIPVLGDDNSFDTIAVSHGRVIVKGNECGTQDPYGYIDAFDSDTGAFVWQHAYPDGVAAMEVSGSYVIAHVKAGIESSPLTAVYKILNGKTVWSTASNPDTNCDAQPWVVGGFVFVSYCSGSTTQLRALRLATGALAWKKAGRFAVLGGDSDTSAARHLYVYESGHDLLDLNPGTGITRFAIPGAGDRLLAVDHQRLYVDCAASRVYQLCGLDVATGGSESAWSYDNGDPGLSGAVDARGVLYLDDGVVLNATNGHYITTLPGKPVVVGNGHVGVLTSAGDLAIYGLPG